MSSNVKFNRGPEFEKMLTHALISDSKFAEQMYEILDDEYFSIEYLKFIVRLLFNYYKEYRLFPSLKVVIMSVEKNVEQGIKKEKLMEYLNEFKKPIGGDLPFVKKEARNFCKNALFFSTVDDCVRTIEGNKYDVDFDDLYSKFMKAIRKGEDRNIGHDFKDDFDKRMIKAIRNPVATPWPLLNKHLDECGPGIGEISCIAAPSGCHLKGTKVIMFDGSLKNVEDVKIGDQLMGPSSTPRNVLKTINGTGKMYKIIPIKGKEFIVNDEHILRLQSINEGKKYGKTGKEYAEISIKDYLDKSKYFKSVHKLYKVPIEFKENNDLEIDPYFLGLLLGDGCLVKSIMITTMDKEIEEQIYKFSDFYGTRIYSRKKIDGKASDYFFRSNYGKNIELHEGLKKLNLLEHNADDKFIPNKYKINSIENRLKILAGLLDTDGHYVSHGKCFEYVSASKKLANDVLFIAHSLGFGGEIVEKIVNGKIYYRMHISGDCSIVPTKIKRKQAEKRLQKKDVLKTGFDIEYYGIDEYFGFQLDEDNLYLLDDFTVMHNCGKSHILVDVGYAAAFAGKTVVYCSLELSEIKIGNRFTARHTGIPLDDLTNNKEKIKKDLETLKGQINIKEYSSMDRVTILKLKNHIEYYQSNTGKKVDLLIVDYAGLMNPVEKSYHDRYDNMRCVFEELVSLGKDLRIPVWTAFQTNRSSVNKEIIDIDSIAEAFSIIMASDLFLTFNVTNRYNREGGWIRKGKLFVAKSRLGSDKMVFDAEINTSVSKLDISIPKEEAQEQDQMGQLQKRLSQLKNQNRCN